MCLEMNNDDVDLDNLDFCVIFLSKGFPYKTAEALKDDHEEELKRRSKSKWD